MELPWATFSARATGALADLALVALVSGIPVTILSSLVGSNSTDLALLISGFIVFVWAIYAAIFLLRPGEHAGQTWGKQLGKTRLITTTGHPLSAGQVILRESAKSLSVVLAYDAGDLFHSWAFFVYLLLAAYWVTAWRTPEHQAPHDMLCRTRVVDESYRVEELEPSEII